MAQGSWSLAEELFARGEAAFVGELRRVHDAERLGTFAATWFADRRPFARQALLEYLAGPLNAYRHEALVKRLIKLAEAAGDDELMGLYLVTLDRSVRRQRTTYFRYKSEQFDTRAGAESTAAAWAALGFTPYPISSWSGKFHISATKQEPGARVPSGTAMPRLRDQPIPDYLRQSFERQHVLFSLNTRRYLRRRTWRYFRRLAQRDVNRYATALLVALPRYTDADVDSDLHLLDNWGLTHALFGESKALLANARGWQFAPDSDFTQLAPAPRFAEAWTAERLYAVLTTARCRAVRQWSRRLLDERHADWLQARSARELLALADSRDPELSAFGYALLERATDLADVPVSEWLKRLDGDDFDQLQRLSDLLIRRLDPAGVSRGDALRLALHRSRPVAALGLSLLQRLPATAEEIPTLLPLVQSECAAVRPALVAWLRATLEQFGPARSEWIVEWLDSKHADVRAAGWAWLLASPLADTPAVWHKLLESPYDDVREPLLAELRQRAAGAEPDAVRLLWATVLLNGVHGGRHKPGVVVQIVQRLNEQPAEAEALLQLLAVAVRSGRATEFRTGLAGLVRLAETQPELLPTIRRQFPEIEW